MRFIAPPIFAGLLGVLLPIAAATLGFAQSGISASVAAPAAKTLFLIRTPDGVTPIRSVSYQVQGPVVVLVNEAGGRAVVQTRTVIGRLPWVSDAEIEDGSADLAKLAQIYENYAARVPLARNFLTRETERFRSILKAKDAERIAREKAAADRLAAVTSAVYDADAGYSVEALEALLKPADELRAAAPDAAAAIDRWAQPFRDHVEKLRAGDRYENGAWVTKADLERRAQAAREAEFLRTIDYELSAETLAAGEVRGLVFKAFAATAGTVILGFALVIVFRRGKILRIAGIVLVAGAPLALAAAFFLATRTPGPLPAPSARDDSALVITALADAAGLNPHSPAARTIPENALNFFLARHVHLKRSSDADPGGATREAMVAGLSPGRLSLYELVRCLGYTWIVGYDLSFPGKDAHSLAVERVRIGALTCPAWLARSLWKNLESSLAAILTASKITAHFTVQKPSIGSIQLISKTAPAAVPPSAPQAPTAEAPPSPEAAPTESAAPIPPSGGAYSNAGSDTWVATDNLGRAMPTFEQTGPPKAGKTVGIFYYLWHGQHDKSAFDISRILEKSPNAIHDWNDPAWGVPGGFHYWSEPLWGYYRADDEWVIRKNAQMLADAGVDVVFFDVTNAFRYPEVYQKICDVYTAIRAEGNRTPQVGFLTWSKSGEVVPALYDEFYSKDLHRDLWFQWEGRPLILARPDELSDELKQFFTVRESWAWKPGAGKWPWLEDSPQQGGQGADGQLEQVAVAAASHPNNNVGKSYADGRQPTLEERKSGEGLRFAEQWKRALELDPPLVFVTQWNEWVAQRYKYDGPGQEYAGRPLKTGEPWFIDSYDPEFNRDIEPMKGGYEDNYYYQLAQNVRRFKGARPVPAASGPKTIASPDDWAAVSPVFRDDRGDTFHRDSPGADPATIYRNDWGRNDIVDARVAVDAENAYFLVETAAPLTTPAAVGESEEPAAPAAEADPAAENPAAESSVLFGSSAPASNDHWMQLLIDADRDSTTGWFGYDYVVNRRPAEAAGAVLERYDSSAKKWVPVGNVPPQVDATHLALTIPRKLLPEIAGQPLSFDFKWADNVPLDDMKSPADFLIYGDVAPNARFNYRFLQN